MPDAKPFSTSCSTLCRKEVKKKTVSCNINLSERFHIYGILLFGDRNQVVGVIKERGGIFLVFFLRKKWWILPGVNTT